MLKTIRALHTLRRTKLLTYRDLATGAGVKESTLYALMTTPTRRPSLLTTIRLERYLTRFSK